MSANDYFREHPSQQSRPQLPTSGPPSYSYSPYESSSPYITPVQSHDYLGPKPTTQQHAASLTGRPYDSSSEQIPLKQTSKIQTNQDNFYPQDSQYPLSPETQTPTELLPERQRQRRHRREKKGFFAGRVPWVVYTLSLIQITVFIVEIIRNCKLSNVERWITGTDDLVSYHHRLADYDTSAVQSYDWSFDIRAHKLRCSLCPLHADYPRRPGRNHPGVLAMPEHDHVRF